MSIVHDLISVEEWQNENLQRSIDLQHQRMVQREKDRETIDRILTETDNPEIRQLAEIARRYL